MISKNSALAEERRTLRTGEPAKAIALVRTLDDPERAAHVMLHPDQSVRVAGYAKLSKMGPQAAFPLLKILRHKKAGIREDAARTIAEIGNPQEEVLQALRHALAKEDDIYAHAQISGAIARLEKIKQLELPLR